MLKPPQQIDPREGWIEFSEYWSVFFTCGCGRRDMGHLRKDQSPQELVCRYCQRRERKRLYMRQWRGSDVALGDRACQHCGQSFTPERSTARYCGARCRVAAHRAKQP